VASVRLRNLTKRYGAVTAVDDVTLDVRDGEFLVLLGPSGSGKSTVLKLIAGIEAPDGGEVWIGDDRVDTLLSRYRDVAMVFQSYALYPHMSVAANLAFPLRSAGMGRQQSRARVEEVAALLGLGSLLDRRPGQLSGGQQQRVALGRAIVRRPRLFLMDEPLSNLDAKLRANTRLELTRLHDRLGATTIYVTHDQVEAMTMGHRIAVVDGGVVRQVDEPEVVYEHPADLVVADFVGSPPMNVLPARQELREGALVVTGGGVELRFRPRDLDPRVAAAVGCAPAEVVLGVRPEYLCVGTGPGDEPVPDRTFVARVERVELLGSERVVHLVVGTARMAARVPAAVRPAAGDDVRVGVDAAGVRLFDPATGRRVSPPASAVTAGGPARPGRPG
jgi:multiple sugar transport system ATP-binding protein